MSIVYAWYTVEYKSYCDWKWFCTKKSFRQARSLIFSSPPHRWWDSSFPFSAATEDGQPHAFCCRECGCMTLYIWAMSLKWYLFQYCSAIGDWTSVHQKQDYCAACGQPSARKRRVYNTCLISFWFPNDSERIGLIRLHIRCKMSKRLLQYRQDNRLMYSKADTDASFRHAKRPEWTLHNCPFRARNSLYRNRVMMSWHTIKIKMWTLNRDESSCLTAFWMWFDNL